MRFAPVPSALTALCRAAVCSIMLAASPSAARADEPRPVRVAKVEPLPATEAPSGAGDKADKVQKKAPAPDDGAGQPTVDEPKKSEPKKSGLAGFFDEEKDPAARPIEVKRRNGFMIGVLGGLSLGNTAGYPNDPTRQSAGFYQETSFAAGGGGTAWIGGAFNDWLSFGVGYSGLGLFVDGKRTVSHVVTFHTEVFPGFPLGGALFKDLGLMLDAGTGTTVLEPEQGGPALADGGGVARVSAGVFWEGLRVSKLSAGPFIAFDHVWSGTMSRPTTLVGLRASFYANTRP